MWGHRFLTYHSLAHVSLLLREPGRRTGLRVSSPVQLSDLYPTILNAVGERPETPDTESARDLFKLAALGGEQRVTITEYAGPLPATAEFFRERSGPDITHRVKPQVAAFDGRLKYMASADGRRELYDLRWDPEELHNLANTRLGDIQRLAAYVSDWLQRTPEFRPTREDAVPPMSPAAVEALRSLGYIDD
jgi:arylsulfatase A-like enzyme